MKPDRNGGRRCRTLAAVVRAMAMVVIIAMAGGGRAALGEQEGTSAGERRELNIFPFVGGDSDVGFGGGQFSDWAVLPADNPNAFVWKLEDAAFITFKLSGDSLVIPFVDVWALLTIPHFGPGGRYRLEVRPSFTDERTLGYYGIGNASPYPVNVPTDATEYQRMHPTLAARVKRELVDGLSLELGSSFTASWLTIPADSLILRDARDGPPEVRHLLSNLRSTNGVELVELALEYDTRDNETVTSHGQYDALLVRGSPAAGAWMPYSYLQVDATLRYYSTPVPRWLALSYRVVGDAILGNSPFYELARFDDTPAIGGGKAIRGVPAQRYHGKVKLFGNLESRTDVWSFAIAHKPMVLGVAGFIDCGRTWTELGHAYPALDGQGLGLKYGVGGGLRLLEGRTFVVRADLAWSPDALPIGAYFDAGEIF